MWLTDAGNLDIIPHYLLRNGPSSGQLLIIYHAFMGIQRTHSMIGQMNVPVHVSE